MGTKNCCFQQELPRRKSCKVVNESYIIKINVIVNSLWKSKSISTLTYAIKNAKRNFLEENGNGSPHFTKRIQLSLDFSDTC